MNMTQVHVVLRGKSCRAASWEQAMLLVRVWQSHGVRRAWLVADQGLELLADETVKMLQGVTKQKGKL